MFLRFLSWHQTWFSATNLIQIILHCSFLATVLSSLYCSLLASSVVPICLLALCVSLGLASVKFWCHSLDILLLLVSAFWFLSAPVYAFHVFQPLWVKSWSRVSKLDSSPGYPKRPKLKGKAGGCEGAHVNVHKHKMNWAEPSWPKPLRCSTDLCELCQNTVLFWKQALLRVLHDLLENHEFPVSMWLLRTWFANLHTNGQLDAHGNEITSCSQVSNYLSGKHLTIPWVIHWGQIRSKTDINSWYSENSSNTFRSSCSKSGQGGNVKSLSL